MHMYYRQQWFYKRNSFTNIRAWMFLNWNSKAVEIRCTNKLVLGSKRAILMLQNNATRVHVIGVYTCSRCPRPPIRITQCSGNLRNTIRNVRIVCHSSKIELTSVPTLTGPSVSSLAALTRPAAWLLTADELIEHPITLNRMASDHVATTDHR